MTPEANDLFKNIMEKILQKNTFECNHCGAQITYVDENHYPLFPCQHCEKIDWKVYSINDQVIYGDR